MKIQTRFIVSTVKAPTALRQFKNLIRLINRLINHKCRVVRTNISAAVFVLLELRRELLAVANERGVKRNIPAWLLVASGLILPILPVNIIAQAVLQHNVNKLYEIEG